MDGTNRRYCIDLSLQALRADGSLSDGMNVSSSDPAPLPAATSTPPAPDAGGMIAPDPAAPAPVALGAEAATPDDSGAPPVLPFLFAGMSDLGRVRSANQDRFLALPVRLSSGDATLLAVADGMGGAAGGEVASAHAVEELLRVMEQASADAGIADILADAVVTANRVIWEHALDDPHLHGMGTTLVAVLVRGAQMVVAHVGDSRAGLVHNGVLRRLTADHSWVAERVRMGDMTEEEAAVSTFRNVLTRSIGVEKSVAADVSEPITLEEGDVLVLCSDGLHSVADDATITSVVRDADPAAAARQLIDLANARGGPDNVTVVVGRLGAPPPQPASAQTETLSVPLSAPATRDHPDGAPRPRRKRRRGVLLAIALLVAAGLVLAAVAALRSSTADESPPAPTPAPSAAAGTDSATATAALTASAAPPGTATATATAALTPTPVRLISPTP